MRASLLSSDRRKGASRRAGSVITLMSRGCRLIGGDRQEASGRTSAGAVVDNPRWCAAREKLGQPRCQGEEGKDLDGELLVAIQRSLTFVAEPTATDSPEISVD